MLDYALVHRLIKALSFFAVQGWWGMHIHPGFTPLCNLGLSSRCFAKQMCNYGFKPCNEFNTVFSHCIAFKTPSLIAVVIGLGSLITAATGRLMHANRVLKHIVLLHTVFLSKLMQNACKANLLAM